MDNYKALPKLQESLVKMIERGKPRLGTVMASRPGVVDVRLSDGTVATYATSVADLPVDQSGVVVMGIGRNGFFIPLDMPNPSNIPDGAVTTPKIADGAVTTAKLAVGSVTNAKIASGTIVSSNIADGAITGSNIAPGTVTSSNITNGTILYEDLHSDITSRIQTDRLEMRQQEVVVNSGAQILQALDADGLKIVQHGSVSYMVNIGVNFGTDANQVARGNHTHTINGTFTKTHTVNTTTTPRTQPGTSSYAQSTIASGTQVTMLMDSYGFVTSNGIDWAQIFEKGRGVCWVNSDHLTAI